jgi:hypothetical protein
MSPSALISMIGFGLLLGKDARYSIFLSARFWLLMSVKTVAN